MSSVCCPACDEEMEIEPDWYGRKVACPGCGERFVARRPGEEVVEQEPPRPRRRRAWEEDDEPEERSRKKKPKRDDPPMPMGRGTKQLILAAAIVGPILLMCLGCGGWLAFLVFAPVNYPDPWVNQSLPDGSYSVRFPRTPTADPIGGKFGFGEMSTKWMYTESGAADAAFVFGHMDNLPQSFDQALQDEISHIKRETGAKASSPKPMTSAGLSGQEVEFRLGPSKIVYRMLDASTGGQKRFILVMAGGRSVSEADRNKFLDSLKAGR